MKSILSIKGAKKLTREQMKPVKGGNCNYTNYFNYISGIWEWTCEEVQPCHEEQ